ncbi:MAG: hypothetical protein QOK26_3183, partial [Pseudonocardiales bacterium]|nr:hypothetical protein [Pseudonocardiales bacterium]
MSEKIAAPRNRTSGWTAAGRSEGATPADHAALSTRLAGCAMMAGMTDMTEQSGGRLGRRPVVGVLHPGAMGAALGSALKAKAGVVIWADGGRSHATAKRAELADLIAVPDVAALARR